MTTRHLIGKGLLYNEGGHILASVSYQLWEQAARGRTAHAWWGLIQAEEEYEDLAALLTRGQERLRLELEDTRSGEIDLTLHVAAGRRSYSFQGKGELASKAS